MEDPLLSLRFHTTISKLLSTGTHITAEPVSKIDNLYNSEITTTLCLLYRLKDKLPSTGTHDQHSDGDSDAGSITTGGGDDSDADPQFVECIEVFSKLGHTVLGGKRSGEGEYERLCEEEEDVEEILVKLERRQGILESLLKRSMSGEKLVNCQQVLKHRFIGSDYDSTAHHHKGTSNIPPQGKFRKNSKA